MIITLVQKTRPVPQVRPNDPVMAMDEMLVVPTAEGVYYLDCRQIVRIQSISNYSKIFLNNGQSLITAKVLRHFDKMLSHKNFYRIHRSHLINLRYLHQYLPGDNGKVILKNGDRIDVSRRKKANWTKAMRSFNQNNLTN